MMHARTLKIQIIADIPDVNAEWDAIPMLDRQTLALAKSLKESTVLPNLERYARQLASQADRAIKLFLQLRDQRRPPTEPVVEPNEPEVMAEHYKTEPCQPPSDPCAQSSPVISVRKQPNEPKPLATPLGPASYTGNQPPPISADPPRQDATADVRYSFRSSALPHRLLAARRRLRNRPADGASSPSRKCPPSP